MGRVHVADERVAVLDHDLPATRHIRASDLSYVFTDTKLGCIAIFLAHEFFSSFEWSSFFYQAGCDVVNWVFGNPRSPGILRQLAQRFTRGCAETSS